MRTTADDALERSARFWMRAYPRRWRRDRGEELLGLLLDLTAPGASRLPLRSALELVVAGWSFRVRNRPPVGPWLLYRSFDRRIPRGYAGWADDDIAGATYLFRAFVGQSWWVWLIVTAGSGAVSFELGRLLLVLALAATVTWPDSRRAQARLTHVVVRAGEPVVPGSYGMRPAPRTRVAARSGARWAGSMLGVAALTGLLAALLSPVAVRIVRLPGEPAAWEFVDGTVGDLRAGVVALLVAGLVVGLVLGVAAARNLPRALPLSEPQPHRVLVPVSGRLRLRLLVVVVGIVAAGWSEMSGEWVVGVAVVLGAVAFALLPATIVALLRVRRTTDLDGLAVRDLPALLSGKAPRVDGPVQEVGPIAVTAAEGAWAGERPTPEPPYPAVG